MVVSLVGRIFDFPTNLTGDRAISRIAERIVMMEGVQGYDSWEMVRGQMCYHPAFDLLTCV